MSVAGRSHLPIYSCKYSKRKYTQHQLLTLVLIKEYTSKDYRNVVELVDLMEGDFIIIEDFNADGSYFDEDSTSDIDEYTWVIDDSIDTTTKNTDYTYDRIVLTDSADFTGEAGVFRYDLEYDLDEELTTDVSDHYPVYTEFKVEEDVE